MPAPVPDGPLLAHLSAQGLPHQGIAASVAPLKGPLSEDLIAAGTNVILALDQVTDPHNIGACMRSAAAFGAGALVTQDRNTPGESGALAKAASGALEVLPWCRVGNVARAFETLKTAGYWIVGLDGAGDILFTPGETALEPLTQRPIVLAMGSEGRGMRPLVRRHCDLVARIDIDPQMESLNVSNAAAVALFALKLMRGTSPKHGP